MKKAKMFALAAGFGFAMVFTLSACAVVSQSKISAREAEQFQGTAVMYYPMIAKIKIEQEKINHTYANEKCTIEKSCEILAYNDALKKLNIDGIFEPIYHHEVTFPKSTIKSTITVTGYPYKFKEFREITQEDKDLLASPGSTWIPVQTNSRPYITNDTKTTTWTWTGLIVILILTGTLGVIMMI